MHEAEYMVTPPITRIGTDLGTTSKTLYIITITMIINRIMLHITKTTTRFARPRINNTITTMKIAKTIT